MRGWLPAAAASAGSWPVVSSAFRPPGIGPLYLLSGAGEQRPHARQLASCLHAFEGWEERG